METGRRWTSDEDEVSAVAETEEDLPKDDGGDFDRIKEDGGPGMPLNTYLPKEERLAAKLRISLTPFG